MMVNVAECVFASFIALLGVVTALDCFSCDWNSKNGTVDDNCLVAPYKTQVKECTTSDNIGVRYTCQTHAQFELAGNDLHLITLERNCGPKHSKCNNLCSDESLNCWLCCSDNDKCNGFPLRGNVMTVSSAPWQRICVDKILLFFIAWTAYVNL